MAKWLFAWRESCVDELGDQHLPIWLRDLLQDITPNTATQRIEYRRILQGYGENPAMH